MENRETTTHENNKVIETLTQELESLSNEELHEFFKFFYKMNHSHSNMMYLDHFEEFLGSFDSNPFKVNEDKYACNHRSLDLFLHCVDIIIFDEYGKEMTPEEFWEKHGNSKGDNFKTYYENHPERVAPFRGYDLDDFINVEGMWWCNKEFY
jgi:hypothetical protein